MHTKIFINILIAVIFKSLFYRYNTRFIKNVIILSTFFSIFFILILLFTKTNMFKKIIFNK